MKTWYEVFVSYQQGSSTLATFKTLKEAKKYKKEQEQKGETSLFIDKWENIKNPKIIKE